MVLPRLLASTGRRRSPSASSASSSSSSITMVQPPSRGMSRRQKQQLAVLALCRLCEPIAFMSIFPYIYYMVKSFGVASSDTEIAIYAGGVTSAFAAAEFACSVAWGRLSDRIGRKPVLLAGLAGTGVSMLAFGFAPNLVVALLARSLGGLLNGNIGVLQTTVSELVPDEEQRPTAFALMPSIWCLGSIIGSGLGGLLAEPVKNYPGTFAPGTIFDKFPFLLPNLVCTAVVLCGLAIGILFLEETHEEKKLRRDAGLEVGKWILDLCTGRSGRPTGYSKLAEASLEETTYLMQVDQAPPDYISETNEAPLKMHDLEAIDRKVPPSATSAYTPQVMLNVLAYGILAYHTITFEQLLPVLLSMEDSETPANSIFKFVGGFGLPTSTIGYILSAQGVYQMFAQLRLFPAVERRFGRLAVFRFTALTYPMLYLLVPYLTWLPRSMRLPGLALVLVWKVTHQALAYPSSQLLLTRAAPSPMVLGFVNGLAASAASLARAVGPTLSGLIQSAGLQEGYLGIPWWSSAAVAMIGAGLCLCLQTTANLPQGGAGDAYPAGAAHKTQQIASLREDEGRLSDVSETTLTDEAAQPQRQEESLQQTKRFS